jgi:sugar lactone lactonase YvrE
MWLRNFKIWLVAFSIALISACGSQDSGSNADSAFQANNKSSNIANTSLLDSLATLYPNGQMSEQQKTFAAKELLQNPAALRKTAPASASVSGQSSSGTVKAQVATGNFGPVYRIQNTALSGSYFFTIYDSERDSALALHPEWKLEGTAFYTSRVAAPGLSPVHRFQSKLNGSYLFTIYDAERADIVANYSASFAYEGISWYASQTAEAGYTPLYRFRNKLNGTYLFSSYESEKEAIVANYAAIFELEGIAYYVRQTDPLELSLLAGGLGGTGNLDGVGSEARFGSSTGIVVDAAGNAFVTDLANRIIRKVTPAGQVTTFVGNSSLPSGSVDGAGTAASFASLSGITIDSVGNLFVTDSRVIRKITPAGVVTTFAGNSTSNATLASVDGAGTAATFRRPAGIAIDNADNLYVADTNNYTIRKITPAGMVSTIAGDVTGGFSPTPVNGAGLSARFLQPNRVTVDIGNNIYVVDSNRLIRKITPAGVVSTFAGSASGGVIQDGTGTSAVFSGLIDIKVDAAGNIFTLENSLFRAIRKITSTGVVTTFAGVLTNISTNTNPVDGTGAAARFGSPSALTTDATGNLLVIDSNTFRKVTPDAVVTTIAGKSAQTGTTDGTGAAARFLNANDMVVDSMGNLLVISMLEGGNNFVIRKVSPEGVSTTFVGGGVINTTNPTGDGTGVEAALYFPSSLAIDTSNNLYVTEPGVVRKITQAGVVSTIAGVRPTTVLGGAPVSPLNGTGAAARFTSLGGIAVDSAGNLFVSEGRNIRKITPSAEVTTFANIPNTNTLTFTPSLGNIAIDGIGTLYVVDSSKIHKVTASAEISVFAGDSGSGYADGDISVAKFSSPTGLSFDASNNMYLADRSNNVVRKITPAGQASTVVGTARRIGVIEGLLSGAANLANPSKVRSFGGKLYILDENSILKVNGLP